MLKQDRIKGKKLQKHLKMLKKMVLLLKKLQMQKNLKLLQKEKKLAPKIKLNLIMLKIKPI